MALDGISFLPADVSSSAFGRERSLRADLLSLDEEQVASFDAVIEETVRRNRADFDSGFVAESPEKLHRVSRYYAALNGDTPFPPVSRNAPYVSIVVEADAAVRPCYFHEPIGNIRLAPFGSIVANNLPAFRRTLDFETNPVCARCVCSLKVGWRDAPWK